MNTPFRIKKSRLNSEKSIVFQGVRFDICRIQCPTASGGHSPYDVMLHPGAVVLLPFFHKDSIVMIRNYRIAVDQTLWELPAGTLEAGEDPKDTALRELIEETGYKADSIEPLATFYTSPGISNEVMHAFIARELHYVGQHLDESEVIQPEVLSWDQVLKMIRSGEICDSKTLTTLLYYQTFRDR